MRCVICKNGTIHREIPSYARLCPWRSIVTNQKKKKIICAFLFKHRRKHQTAMFMRQCVNARACIYVCARVCVRARVCVCVRACVWCLSVFVSYREHMRMCMHMLVHPHNVHVCACGRVRHWCALYARVGGIF